MNSTEKEILDNFKKLLKQKKAVKQIILYGSRARGDAAPDSDMDIVVIVDHRTPAIESWISDCAWEAGVDYGIVVCSIVYSTEEWEGFPCRFSSFAKAVQEQGIPL